MKSLQEIQAIRDVMHPELELRNVGSKEAKSKYERQVLICGGTGCTSSGSPEIERVLREEIEKAGLTDKIQVVKTGCFGLCALGPIMIVYPSGAFYSRISAENIPQIVTHCRNALDRIEDVVLEHLCKFLVWERDGGQLLGIRP